MAAGLGALRGQRVGAGRLPCEALGHVRRGADHVGAGRLQARDVGGVEHAEREARDRHAQRDERIELRAEVGRVARGRRAGRQTERRVQRIDRGECARNRRRVGRRGLQHEQVHGERARGRRANRRDFGDEPLGLERAAREAAERARVGCGRDHRGGACADHRCLHERQTQAETLGERSGKDTGGHGGILR